MSLAGSVLILLLYGTYALACVLEAVTVALAIKSFAKRDVWNGFLLFAASMPLFIGAWAMPKLSYYVAYGIQTKVQAYRQTVPWILAAAAIPCLFVRGRAKWPPLLATAIITILLYLR